MRLQAIVPQKGNIIYISKYGKAEEDFIKHLNRINPDFNESWIMESHVFKDDYAQETNPTGDDKVLIRENRGLNNVIRKAYRTILLV